MKRPVPLDPLAIPLEGTSLIEASAGTGKTYALTSLFLRLIVEKGLDVEQILVVTFTRAATDELKTRIRARLAQALPVFSDPSSGDPFLQELAARGKETGRRRVEDAIRHFDEWWLVGSTYTAHWAPGGEVVAADPNNMDIINHYVAEGLGGGIVKLALFVTMIVVCFRIVGRWVRELDDTVLRPAAFLVWSLGACLFAHCISFFSVSYFDQIVIMYYWLLAVIASLGLVLESRRWALAAQDSAAFPADPNLQGAEAAPGLAEPATLNGGN